MIDQRSDILKGYTYDAFISYRHVEPDITIAKKLHRILENYRIPKSIAKQCGINKIKRVFRDQEELPTSGNLSKDIRSALENSRFLIVICSKNTPKSKYCCEEIEIFKDVHSNDNILPILIDGEPDESFPYPLRVYREKKQNSDGTYIISSKEVEPLAADIREVNQRKAIQKLKVEKLRLLAPMLGVSFDDLRKRHREQFIKKAVSAVLAASIFLSAFGCFSLFQSNMIKKQRDEALRNQSLYLADLSRQQLAQGDRVIATMLALKALPENINHLDRPYVIEAESALRHATLFTNDSDYLSYTVLKHSDFVRSIEFSRDGDRIATTSNDNTAKIWDVGSGKELIKMEGQSNILISGSFNPEGNKIITTSLDAPAIIWDSATGKKFMELPMDSKCGPPTNAYYSPDGKKIIVICHNGVLICDSRTGVILISLIVDDSFIEDAQFSPNGNQVVTTMNDCNAIIWDVSTGKQLIKLQGQNTARFNAIGDKLVTTFNNNPAIIWDVSTGIELFSLAGHNGTVNMAEFSPDGSMVVTASEDNTAIIWDVLTGKQLSSLQIHTDGVNTAKFSPDGSKIVTASSDKTAVVWDVKTGTQLAVLKGHNDTVDDAIFSPDGSKVATLSSDNTARIWIIKSERKFNKYLLCNSIINTAKFSPDGSKIVTAQNDNTAVIWDVSSGNQLTKLEGHIGPVNTSEFSPDGNNVVTASDDKSAIIWEVRTGKKLVALEGHSDSVKAAEFSPDGYKVATVTSDNSVFIWDAATGNKLAKFEISDAYGDNIGFNPDGNKVFTTSDDYKVSIWDIATGKKSIEVPGLPGEFSPDGSKFLTINGVFVAAIWDALTGKELVKLKGHGIYINSCKFSPDGSKIVTASMDKTAIIWDVATGKQLFRLRVGFYCHDATFSPDGSKVVTTSSDQSAIIWDVENGIELYKLEAYNNMIKTAEFSHDNNHLLTIADDNIVIIWKIRSLKEVMDEARQRLNGREFTSEEQKEFFITK